MNEQLAGYDWENLFNDQPVPEIWDTFQTNINCAINKHVPKVHINSNLRPMKQKWMTKHALNKIQRKEEAWQRYRHHKSARRFRYYCKARNEATTATREAKAHFERDIAFNVKKNKRAFYSYVRSQTTIKEGVSKIKKPDGTFSSSNKEACEIMNKAFSRSF